MKISLNWLADYVELPADSDELARKLTMAGLEVEGIERLGEGLDGVVVGHILESKQHPNAEKLSVTKVDAGKLGQLQIVCGAKNYKVGDKVPLATLGTKLPGGLKIEKAKLRGEESFGMLCSEKELGLAEEASGLLILDPSLVPGTPIAEALHLKDVVFEVNVTPNRSDCLSHLGIAREVAALTGKALKLPHVSIKESGKPASQLVKVKLEEPERCPRYAARVLEGVKLGPSPMWMQSRLRAVGIRAISNAVDVTNYVLMECGQPLHAFDLDLVAEQTIVVRKAKAAEKMTTLDGKERELSAEDLVIADAKAPSALAGVMGGATSEVSAQTRRILLESAYFAPGNIRRTARRHALHSESSHRFERGVDPEGVLFAQDRAAKLLAELCQATVAPGRVDACPKPAARRTFTLRFERVGQVLGTPVEKSKVAAVLTGLGFQLELSGETAKVTVPSWRGDVEGEADCVEEVARTLGFGSIPAALPRGVAHVAAEPMSRLLDGRLRGALSAAGFDEVVNYSFVGAKDLEVLTPGVKPIAVKNPLSLDQAVMCTTRLAGLLQNVKRSLNRQVADVRLYELGRIYLPQKEKGAKTPADEQRMLTGVMVGSRTPQQWGQPAQAVDFFDLKGALEQVLEASGIKGAQFVPARSAILHPRSAAELKVGEVSLGTMGELHPKVAQALDMPRGVYVFELRCEALEQVAQLVPASKGVPRFPAVLRDIALILDDQVAAAAVEAEIRSAGGGLVEEALLFDQYRGQNIPAGKKSLAYAIRYRAADRTLTDEETLQAQGRIVARLGEKFGAELRAQ